MCCYVFFSYVCLYVLDVFRYFLISSFLFLSISHSFILYFFICY